jgi:hypothetical protein
MIERTVKPWTWSWCTAEAREDIWHARLGRGLLVGGKVERAGAQPRASVRPGVER